MVGGKAVAGSWWGALSMRTLVEHARIPWIKTEASYYCVIEPVFDSAGQSREKDLIFFFSQQMIFIEFTSLNLLKNFLEMSYFSHIFMNQGGADVQRDLHQNFCYLITMFDNGLIMGCSENITTHLLW